MYGIKEFLKYINFPYEKLNKVQQNLIDTYDYAEKNNLQIIEIRQRGVFHTNITDIWEKYLNAKNKK